MSQKLEVIIGIYGLFCKPSKKWYVGRTKHIYKRWGDYRRLKFSKQWKLHRAILKYGIENFGFHILERRSNLHGLKARENYWIEKKDSLHNGYNCYGAGDTLSNVCKETRKKISEGLKNSEKFQAAMKSPEYRKKLSKIKMGTHPWLGLKHTLETKKKMSESSKGHHRGLGIKLNLTDEQRRARSERMMGNTFSTGRTLTEEDKEKKRQAALWRWANVKAMEEITA